MGELERKKVWLSDTFSGRSEVVAAARGRLNLGALS